MDNQEVVHAPGAVVAPTEATEVLEAAEGAEQPEAQPEPAKPAEPSPEEQKFAAKFAALSRKEKAIKQREAQIAQKMQEMEAKLKAFEEQQAEVQKFRDIPNRLKQNPFEVLKEQGIDEAKLVEYLANDGKPTQDMVLQEYEKKVMSKVQELEQKLQQKEEAEKQQKYEQALQQFQAQLTDFVNKTEDYDLIRANDATDLVYQVIEQHHEETGQILSNKEACDAVESYLLEEAKKLVDRDKVKKLLQGSDQATKPQNGQKTAAKTLSNAAAAQAPKSSRKLSDEESKAEAAKLIKWID